MVPMLPLCDSRAMMMPMAPALCPAAPAMMPMIPMSNTPMLCPVNPMNLCTIATTMTNEYDSRMYGRFRHVEREHPRYRHAPFDWYRPPKQYHHVVHEDAAVVTLDGPVPLGDFYRHYIYGDDEDYDDEYYDDEDSFESDRYDDREFDDEIEEPPYEARSINYRRGPRRNPYLDDDLNVPRPPLSGPGSYRTSDPTRRTAPSVAPPPVNPAMRGTRNLAGDDDFDDAASVNSTYGN